MNRRFPTITLFGLFAAAAVAATPFRYPEEKRGAVRLQYVQSIPVLTVGGSPEQIGMATGRMTKPAAEGLFGYFDDLLKRSRLDAAWPWLVRTSEGMLTRFPESYRIELEAGVKASGLPRDKVVVANCLWDIKKLGCSTLFVGPDRSATGQPLMGRNFDFPTLGILQKYSLVIVTRPDGKHAFASVGFPGLVGVVSGMNDAGLCIATLDVKATGDGSPPFDLSGTPLILTFRRVLEECTTVAEAEALLRSVKRTTLMNLAVCDAAGTGVVFELTPKSVGVRKAEDGLCCCTNHFRTDELVTDKCCDRFEALSEAKNLAKLGLKDVQQRLHAANQGAGTLQTMIFEPATRTLHLAIGEGPTTAKPLVKLDLAPLFVAKAGP
ncbi:MAG TPA: C45 family peptidase [Gemmataceae bacterium]|nr:C45 family peptidase [Gemmataceae bacterium]